MAWILTHLKRFANKAQEFIPGRSLANGIDEEKREIEKKQTENKQKDLKTKDLNLKEFNLKSLFNQSVHNQNLFSFVLKNKLFIAMLIFAFKKRLLNLRYLAFLAWLKRKRIRSALQSKIAEIEDEAFENKSTEPKFEKLIEYRKNPNLFAKLHQDSPAHQDLSSNKEKPSLNKISLNPELFFNFINNVKSKGTVAKSADLRNKSHDSSSDSSHDSLNAAEDTRKNIGKSPKP